MDGARTFVIESCLGRGGFGEVYRARMSGRGTMERDVAVKVLRRDIDPDGQAVRRLRDEGRLLARLDHPTILRVHDLVLLDGRISLVTELVDGQDLTACIQPPAPLQERALLGVLAQVAGALDAAWSTVPPGRKAPLRMVHRDIKPSNIRISRHGHVKLLDFGIARTDEVERESRTRTGMLVGSPAYMAPERFMEAGVLIESDVFALGAILFEGTVGERFYGTLPIPMQVGLAVAPERYAAHLQAQLGRVEDPSVRELLRGLLAFVPSDRPGPAEVQRRFTALGDELGGDSLDRWCRHRVWTDRAGPDGELVGRTVVEGLLAPPTGPNSLSPSLVPGSIVAVPAPAPSIETLDVPGSPLPHEDGPLLGLGSLSALALLTLLLGSGSVGAGLAVSSGLLLVLGPTEPVEPTERVETDVTAPVRVPEPSAEAIVPPRPEPEPVPAPTTPRPAKTSPTPAPAPPVEAPPVDPEAPVLDDPSRFGRVEQEGADAAFAVSESSRVRLPAWLPPGRHEIHAAFGERDPAPAGEVTVEVGRTHRLVCSRRMLRCR